ncbi:lipoprotein [Desulfovibrio psychrotolerans]|uniref:Lipoprotein n=2 Tax=Desulfovibrio psychrotolerans TaxID=415242 RepID=A0A7J0BV22_9BACT|nr:lipoprotein [Desulfovibrio psychrotolerans]
MNAVDFGALSSGRAEQFDPVTAMRVSKTPETVMMDGMAVPMRSMRTIDSGIVVPDGNGGLIWREGARPEPDPSHVAARELKLKVRELADQLLSNIDRKFMKGVTAMPVSLVNQDDFEESSSFGRYMAEALFYEFNQRGFPVREYRGGDLVLRKGEGEFLLSRAQQQIYVDSGMTMFVAGTYYQDKQNVFVNVRMFRAADGMVLRTAQLVFPQSDVSRRMLANTGKRLEETYVGMNDYDMLTRAFDLTAFDLGEDFH